MRSASNLQILLALTLVAAPACRRDSAWVRRSFERARESGSLLALSQFVHDHPESQSARKARALIASRYDEVLASHEKRGATAPSASAATRRAFAALLGHLRGERDPRVHLLMGPPEGASLEEADRLLARLSRPGAPVAPISPSFLGRRIFGYEFARGANAALKTGLGVDAVVFSYGSLDRPKPSWPTAEVTWKVRASGRLFSRPNVRRAFAGIVVEAEVVILLPGGKSPLRFRATVEPEAEFKFQANRLSLGFAGSGSTLVDQDLYDGMVASAFQVFGQRLLDRVTGLAPPKAEVVTPEDAERARCEKDGEQGACAALGRRLLDPKHPAHDRPKALALLEKACGYGHGCDALAFAQLRAGGDLAVARARLTLETGCREGHAEACRLRAEMTLGSEVVQPWVRPSPTASRDPGVLRLLVKGCDLGSARACARAADLFDDPGNPARERHVARIFAERACRGGDKPGCGHLSVLLGALRGAAPLARVLGVPLPKGARLFDVRYATLIENHPELVWFVALAQGVSALPADPGRVTVELFPIADGKRPYTVTPPPGTAQVARLSPHHPGLRCASCGQRFVIQIGCDCPIH